MKSINYLFILVFLLAATLTLHAQDYKIPVQNVKDGKLTLNNFPGDLPVEAYSGNEIIISSDRQNKTPDRAKGLKPVYADGTDNTGMAVAMQKNGNQITLECLLPITQSGSYKIRVPDNFSIQVHNECGHAGNVTVENAKGEVEITNCQGIKLKNVTGPLVLSTISGDINVSVNQVTKDKPVSFASISGDIDVTLPANIGVDIQMETISGGIYSDFDFPSDEKKLKKIGGNSVKSQLNGGGAELKITNISGNIYLRKKAS
jgi:lia operon protein LiaG